MPSKRGTPLGRGKRKLPISESIVFKSSSDSQGVRPRLKSDRKRIEKIHPSLRKLIELALRHSLTLPKDIGRVLARKGHTEAKARDSLTIQFSHQFPNDSSTEIQARVNKAITWQFLRELDKMKTENAEK